ncbi:MULTISPECIES: hypothetical protein [Fischerella]|uniref:hypothetical protein n=1 Tax=Fischerella TaxID=1190 RepID=UPI001F418077|nr:MULTISPECIES: hypothetical protein [Fischerella]
MSGSFLFASSGQESRVAAPVLRLPGAPLGGSFNFSASWKEDSLTAVVSKRSGSACRARTPVPLASIPVRIKNRVIC